MGFLDLLLGSKCAGCGKRYREPLLSPPPQAIARQKPQGEICEVCDDNLVMDFLKAATPKEFGSLKPGDIDWLAPRLPRLVPRLSYMIRWQLTRAVKAVPNTDKIGPLLTALVAIPRDASQSWDLKDYLAGVTPAPQPAKGPLGETIKDYRNVDEARLAQRAQQPLKDADEIFAMQLLANQSGVSWPLQIGGNDKALNQIRELGEFLCEHGGRWRMVLVAYRFKALGGNSRSLEHEWQGICAWQA